MRGIVWVERLGEARHRQKSCGASAAPPSRANTACAIREEACDGSNNEPMAPGRGNGLAGVHSHGSRRAAAAAAPR
ncbi:hypothetical protein [Paenibacillus sp. MMS18-CY102]|uniref:hypothetical protein n=1 Tax=Paenibacillus sp. MMS18-CY102 TaxID=2682849 RepID=UPI0013657F19|nr:hypothetical protein [Paenibacillus sp. MMS18-CY102]